MRLWPPRLQIWDCARDNDDTESARVSLRYGWKDVAGSPCATAAQGGRLLASRGWQGRLRRCPAGLFHVIVKAFPTL